MCPPPPKPKKTHRRGVRQPCKGTSPPARASQVRQAAPGKTSAVCSGSAGDAARGRGRRGAGGHGDTSVTGSYAGKRHLCYRLSDRRRRGAGADGAPRSSCRTRQLSAPQCSSCNANTQDRGRWREGKGSVDGSFADKRHLCYRLLCGGRWKRLWADHADSEGLERASGCRGGSGAGGGLGRTSGARCGEECWRPGRASGCP